LNHRVIQPKRSYDGRPILRVALAAPLRQLFDYLGPIGGPSGGPTGVDTALLKPGIRVRVPFGRRRAVGVLIETAASSEVPSTQLKPVIEALDAAPILDEIMLSFMMWAADYYHHPPGEVLAAALPAAVRAGRSIEGAGARVTESPRRNDDATLEPAAPEWTAKPGPVLTAAQSSAVETLQVGLDKFGCYLLHGVTGSGKTEVYFHIVERVLAARRQALVLVPEIGLTPQLVSRFQERFQAPLVVLHSGLTDRARFQAWQEARRGEAAIVIGTRSAVFSSLARPGVIIVDEEHDASYKQQEGFRYSARDLAVVRAQRQAIPVILGSATPSLETLENARQGRYYRLVLPERPGTAQHPRLGLIDLRRHALESGLAMPTLASIDQHLSTGAQVLVYLNRRGYAPTLFCPGCGWTAPCHHCDARLTVHLRARVLRCHHCGAEQTLPFACPTCGHEVKPVGQGTERIEEALRARFPQATLARLDRDSVRRRGEMQSFLERVASGAARILVGTQMLTKGHHFPDVTLVVIVNADQGLFSVDFRASERLAQTIVQVAGRAGRASRPGEVLIQTEFPEHPLLQSLLKLGYDGFAAAALAERAAAHWPPFSRLALVRADARGPQAALQFLEAARAAAGSLPEGLRILGPVAASMARRAGLHRAQLLLESPSRTELQRFLSGWLPALERLPAKRGIRWSLDVDPADLY
jgi:primosomal protein N' (replication factor Y)